MRYLHLAARAARSLLAVVATVLSLAVAGAAVVAYLTVATGNLTVLKEITQRFGGMVASQRTEALRLDMAVFPETRRLEGRARLTIKSAGAPRSRFYFLLNDALTIRRARATDAAGRSSQPSVHQLWLITVVELDRQISGDESVDLELEYAGDPSSGGLGAGGGLFDAHDVLLSAEDFWYPSDLQSFFRADVTVTLPARLTVVHNGEEIERTHRGDRQRVRWRTERPVAGVALVAGPYRGHTLTRAAQSLQIFLADDIALDADRVLRDMGDANDMLEHRFGPSGFPRMTGFVTRRLRRAFNDGSGVLGLSLRYFRRGDYGFNVLSHEIAHNWWGGTVAEKWLSPGTGGEWIVEGLAEFSSLLAAEERWGRDALTRRLQDEFFDPAHQGVIAEMSVLDNALAEHVARDTIYKKGAYVAMMLRRWLGDEAMIPALRQFVDRFRYQQASDRDLEAVLQEVSGKDLAAFFADWVRSDKLLDLSVDPSVSGQVAIQNQAAAAPPAPTSFRVMTKGGEVEEHPVTVGETVVLPSETDVALCDPQLDWADVLRDNNRVPRLPHPRAVAASSRGDVLISKGEPYPWAPTTLVLRVPDGKAAQVWEFPRGWNTPPVWSADGGRILVGVSEATGEFPAIVSLNAVDGSRVVIGHATSPVPGANGGVFAARADQLLRFDGSTVRTIVRHHGRQVESPVPSPSGTAVAYRAVRGNAFDLRLCDEDGTNDRSLLTWDRDALLMRWAPDGAHLYAVVGGDWDWQIWEIPVGEGPVRVLAREAASIRSLVVSPSGTHLAFVAAPSVTGPVLLHRLYVLDLATGRAEVPASGGDDVWDVTWESVDTLAVVAATSQTPVVIPETRNLYRVRLTDGSIERFDDAR